MQLWAIAFRNLGRSLPRTAVSVIAIATSVLAVLLLKGTISGIFHSMEDNTIRLNAGHVRIIHDEYRVRERLLSLQYPVDGFHGEGIAGMTELLKEMPSVEHVAPRLRFGGMISHEDNVRSVLVIGGLPESEYDLLRADRYVAEGRFFAPGEREAVLGRRLLNRLHLGVGDRFTLVFNTSFGALRGYTFHIVGAIESGLAYLDDGTVFIPLDVAQAATDFGDAVTEVLLLAPRLHDVPSLYEHVTTTLHHHDTDAKYVAVPWYEHSEMMTLLTVGKRVYDIIYLSVLFLASFVVINTFVMIVHERKREIGMLSALGLRPGHIRTLFLMEGSLCGLFGSLTGVVVGFPLLLFLSRKGITIPGIDSLGAELMYPSTLYPILDMNTVGFAFFAGIIVTCVAVYFPARQASRLEPTEALRT